MEVFSFPFQLNAALVASQHVLAGIGHKTMDSVTRSLRENSDRPPQSGESFLSHKNAKTIPRTDRDPKLRTRRDGQDRFLENISLAKASLKATIAALDQLNDFLFTIKKMTIQMTGKTSDRRVWRGTTKEKEKLLAKILSALGNQDMGGYPFSYSQIMTSFSQEAQSGSLCQGDGENMEQEIQPDSSLKLNLLDSGLLTKPLKTLGEDCDLSPTIDSNSRLSDLNLGKGINLGSIRVSNAGTCRDIDLHKAATVGELIDAINSSGIAGLRADINASKTGLELSHIGLGEGSSGQKLSIWKATGRTARDLGISVEGQDLNPILTEKTPVSLLRGGKGVMLGTIKFALGNTEAVIDLGSASTFGEIIDAINDSMPGIIASLNNSKRGISVESKLVGKSLVISDGDGKKSAQGLGISGSPDILGALAFLMEGLNKEDRKAISEGSATLDLGLEEISNNQAKAEAKLKRLESLEARLRGLQPDTLGLLSETSGSDVSRTAADLADQQSLFQSALKRGSAVIQSGFLEFIR